MTNQISKKESKMKMLIMSDSDREIWTRIFEYVYECEEDHYYESLKDNDFKKENHPFHLIHQLEDWFSQVNYKSLKFYDHKLMLNDDPFDSMSKENITNKLNKE